MLIVFATDGTGDDEAAFVHAGALAAARGARLVTMHARSPEEEAPLQLPDAAALAARWGRPIEHERRAYEGYDDVADAVLQTVAELGPDLVVLGTHSRRGLAALLRGSVGEAIARNLECPALVVRDRLAGFADAATGALALRRIVIPAGTAAEATPGIAAARRLLELAGADGAGVARLELLHVGDDDAGLEELGVEVVRERGVIEETILDVARARGASLLVMPTRGHDSIGDVLRGSHTEHVIRGAACPVLTVPI